MIKQWRNDSTLCMSGPVLCTFVQYLITFCSCPEAARVVISGRFVRPGVLDKRAEVNDPSLNSSREKPPKVVAGCISTVFPYNSLARG